MKPRIPEDRALAGMRSLAQFRNQPLGYLRRLAKEHGDICFFRLGPIQAVFLNHPELIREVLVKQKDDFPKMGRQRSVIRNIDGNSLFVKHGPEWLSDRRMVQAMFHPSKMSGYMRRTAIETARRISGWKDQSVVNFEDESVELALQLTGSVLFDEDLSQQTAELRDSVYERAEIFFKEMQAIVTLPESWPLPVKRRKRDLIRTMDRLIYGIMDQKQKSGFVGTDLVSELMRTAPSTEAARRQVRDHINMMFQAGADDLSTALGWMFYLLAKHPTVQAEVKSELDARIMDAKMKDAQTMGANVGNVDFSNLPKLENVAKETLRLYPSTWMFTTRKARRDVVVGQYPIRQKSWVMISPLVTQNDPRFFKSPEAFIPDRFNADKRMQYDKHAFFPFGMGPRVCAAGGFSIMQMVVVAASVLAKYELELMPGQETMDLSPRVTVRPKHGIRIRLHRRSSSQQRAA